MAWSSGSAARSSSCTDVFMRSCRSQIWRKWTYQKLAAAILLILGTHCAAASGPSLGNRTKISIKCWFGMVLGYPSIFEIHTHTNGNEHSRIQKSWVLRSYENENALVPDPQYGHTWPWHISLGIQHRIFRSFISKMGKDFNWHEPWIYHDLPSKHGLLKVF